MLFLYTLLLLLLGAAKFLIGRRVASLERKHIRAARAVGDLLRQASFKEGNSGRYDPIQTAKRQYLLGQLGQKRDRLEGKYHVWQARWDKVSRFLTAVRRWKGKTLPYTFGVVDVMLALAVVDYLGFGEYVSGKHLVQMLSSLVSG